MTDEFNTDERTEAKMIVRVGTAMIITDPEADSVLLGKRCGTLRPGVFALPGGKPNYGEPIEDAVKREIFDETGIVLDTIDKVTWINNFMPEYNVHYVTLVFHSSEWHGVVENKEPDKCEGWDWYDFTNLPKPLWPGLKSVLDEFYTEYQG